MRSTNIEGRLRFVIGKYGTGVRNERDQLLDFCIENNLFITNTNFKYHIHQLGIYLTVSMWSI